MNGAEGAFRGTPLDYAVIVVYFVGVVAFGLWFGRYTRSTKDFFFGGQRFAWWLVAFSGIATTVGSYSFVKYSNVGFRFGLSSTQTYLNDWFWMPIVLFVWLPILYFGRIQSVPEYFERRFGWGSRMAATALILTYLVGYVGINLFTLGRVLESLLGWPVLWGAVLTAGVVMLYMFAGGQTSVIMTDLAQGIILLVAGLGLFAAGIVHLGGFGEFWALLPKGHRYIFSEFNAPADFSFVGIYGQDGLANSGAFFLMNQGILMRFLSLKSVKEARKMAVFWVLVLFPLAAVTVSGGGWIAAALAAKGELATTGKDAFVDVAYYLCRPGIFGFVLAALTAALMSTADTLITAVSAVFVNDIYRPYLRRNREDLHYLRVARVSSMCTVFVGVALVLVFMRSDSIYSAHGMFTAAVTPPIVVAVLLGILWKRYTPAAALATMVGGSVLVGLSFAPVLDDWFLKPFSFGMGPESYKFTRALFGLTACGALGIGVALLTRPRPIEAIAGLVSGTQLEAMRAFKGAEPNRRPGAVVRVRVAVDEGLSEGDAAVLCPVAMEGMAAEEGDLLYVCHTAWWFGGLRSVHLKAGGAGREGEVRISPEDLARAHFRAGQEVTVEKIL